MKALAFLQNQWFSNPDRVHRIIERSQFDKEIVRRRLIEYALFAGCLTGKRIKKAFGKAIGLIVWEEASRQIASKASGSFPPDLNHISKTIECEKPDVIITFGNIATNAVKPLWNGQLITGPHPAARGSHVPKELSRMALEFTKLFPYNVINECSENRVSAQV